MNEVSTASSSRAQISPADPRSTPAFRTTHWTEVLQAAGPESAVGQGAFGQLYSDYWYPLYAYIRRRGYGPPDAEDITQDFFLHVINYQSLAGLVREGGKFRTFLLRLLDNFLANEWDRQRAQKRGGGKPLLSLNIGDGEAKYSMDPPTVDTPETLFERQWVFTLLARVLDYQCAECEAVGKGKLFADLRPHLQGERTGLSYAEVAVRHEMTEGAVKVAVHRLRQRYGELLRKEIARTVGGESEVDQELRQLIGVVAN